MLEKELYERVLSNTIKNKDAAIKLDYYKWKQWNLPWIETRLWLRTIDKLNDDKVYQWRVLNLVEEAVSTMVSLVNWEESEWLPSISTWNTRVDNWFDDIWMWSIYDQIIETNLIFWECYWQVYLDKKTNLPNFSILSPMSIYHENEVYYFVRKYEENKKEIVYVEEYFMYEWVSYMRAYKNNHLVEEKQITSIPFINFSVFWYIKRGMLETQDAINVKLTKLFEVEKYNSDPLLIIKWITLKTWEKVQTWSWWVIVLWNEDNNSWVERLWWEDIWDNFLVSLDSLKKDFYRQSRLWALKNEDLSWITSWYWIQLKLTDTLAFVNKFRTELKWVILKGFNEIYTSFNIDLFNIQDIMFLPIIWEKKKQDESKVAKMWVIVERAKAIKELIDLGYTREEAELYIQDNL